jgi:YggT family protein
MVLLLRIWMQWARCDFYNPFSQFIVKITQPIVGPLRRIIPAMGPIDSASLLIALLLCVVKAFLNPYVSMDGVFIVLAAVLIVIKTLGSLIFWVLLLMAIMSWVSRAVARWNMCCCSLPNPCCARFVACCRQWAVLISRR